jgi:predicted permease
MPNRRSPRRPRTGESPPDWRALVRQRLPDLGLPPEREAEVVEELADLLAEAAADAGVDLARADEVDLFVHRQVPAWSRLAETVGGGRRRLRPRPNYDLEGPTVSFLTGLGNDLRQAGRMLARRPGFTAVAVLATGLGIGLASAMFSLVDYALFRPLPVERPDELVNVYSSTPGGFLPEEPMAWPDVADIRRTSATLSEVTAAALTFVAVEHGGEARLDVGTLVAGNYFDTLGLRPAAGRLLRAEDDRRADPAPVAVLGHSAWSAMFGGSPEAIGSTVRVNGHPLTVVGVVPADYTGPWPAIEPKVWMPLSLRPLLGAVATTNAGSTRDEPLDNRGHRWLWAIGRRAPGASLEQVRDELDAFAANLREAHPESNRERDFVALPAEDVRLLPAIDAGLRTGSVVVMSLVGLVLLIACANVGNMLLARALSRRREMATRLALGAGRLRIVRQLLVEGLLLAVLGAGVGLAVALVSNHLINGLEVPSMVPLSLDLRLDGRVLLFTAGVAALTALLFALAPAGETARTDLTASLREGGRSGRGRSQRLQNGLVLAQVGLSLVLLVCAGLTVRSLLNAHDIDLGFDPRGVVTAGLAPELQGYEEDEWLSFYERLAGELAARPDVERVAYAGHLPLTLSVSTTEAVPERDRDLPEDEWPEADVVDVGAGYFEAMGIEVVRGRSFEPHDRRDAPWVAVVNETMARAFWPGGDAVGRRLAEGSRTYEVIGVARDGKYRTLGESPRRFFYRSLDQVGDSFRTLVVRFRTPELASTGPVRDAVRGIDPHLALANLGTLEEAVSPALILPRVAGRLFGLLGGLGLFLAATGLYGVLAYAVAGRTHEIGVRMAMGAKRRDVLVMVLRHGLGLTALGAVLGVGLALALTRMLRGILYGVSATDPWTFAAVAAVLFAAAALACTVPAQRALAVDPMTALRHE